MVSKNEYKWLANYETHKAYIAEHVHLPNHHKPENRNLHSWARYQCKRIKAGAMPEEQKELFLALMESRSTEHTGGKRKTLSSSSLHGEREVQYDKMA